ncbi:mammalian ependymin-related protein 1-like [Acanthaster planci]|uniref:Mammalian ependymin-related protein 1-like n=1 Tax=Acanthaster planci TaxID=133434 RepID=A0A8B7XF08_ACAPL|nr:mammalian ependymin-related protein 1-like [Acanthaster planci]
MKGSLLLIVQVCLYLCYSASAGIVPVLRANGLMNAAIDPPTPTPCKTPLLWEGRYSEWNHNAGTNNRYTISFDGVKRRKWIEEELKSMRPGRRLFKFLILFDEQVTYKIDPTYNVCTKIPMEPWRNFSIPPSALFEDNYLIGGPEGNLNVTEWSDRQPARHRESWIGGFTEKGCWPVFDIFTFTNDTVSIAYTTRFFDLTSGIKNMSVFDVPAICKGLVTPSTKPPGTWQWTNLVDWVKELLLGPQKVDDGGIELTYEVDVPVTTEAPSMVDNQYPTQTYWRPRIPW